MVLLAIDTSEQSCGAALLGKDGVIGARSEIIGRGHAERLLPMIEELFLETGLSYADIDKLAVTVGPGTFTGLRIGLSVARGLALSRQVPCVGLSGLQILAAMAYDLSEDRKAPVHAIIAGRGGQGFLQTFQGVDETGLPVADCDPLNVSYEAMVPMLTQSALVVGSGANMMRDAGLLGQLHAGQLGLLEATQHIDPAVLGRTAMDLDATQFSPEPLYLRAADAKKAKAILPIAGSGPSAE